jgi:hypothetical protein
MVSMKIKNRINVSSVHLNVKRVINLLLIAQAAIFKEITKIYKLKIKIVISIHVRLIAIKVFLQIHKTIVNNVTLFVKLVLNQVRHA